MNSKLHFKSFSGVPRGPLGTPEMNSKPMGGLKASGGEKTSVSLVLFDFPTMGILEVEVGPRWPK